MLIRTYWLVLQTATISVGFIDFFGVFCYYITGTMMHIFNVLTLCEQIMFVLIYSGGTNVHD